MLREGRGLKQRNPVFINVLVDVGFWTDEFASIFFIPAGDKGFVERDGSESQGFNRTLPVFACSCRGDGGNAHPVTPRSDFFGGKHDVALHIHLVRIAIPEHRDVRLLLGGLLLDVVYLLGSLVKFRVGLRGE